MEKLDDFLHGDLVWVVVTVIVIFMNGVQYNPILRDISHAQL